MALTLPLLNVSEAMPSLIAYFTRSLMRGPAVRNDLEFTYPNTPPAYWQ